MTDNTTDDVDGQNSKLSRRTALALMGTSAVGGAAATGAFSELTADRPIDVEVKSSGGDVETADSGSSELQVTNNAGTTIDAEITTTDSNVYLTGTTGSSSASVSGSNPWTLSGLDSGQTATVAFERVEKGSPTDFEVKAFDSTSGFSIKSPQSVTVASGIAHQFDPTQESLADGDTYSTLTDQIGNFDLPASGDPSHNEGAINGNDAITLDGGSDDSNDFFQNTGDMGISPPATIFIVNDPTDTGDREAMIHPSGSIRLTWNFNGGSLSYQWGAAVNNTGTQFVKTTPNLAIIGCKADGTGILRVNGVDYSDGITDSAFDENTSINTFGLGGLTRADVRYFKGDFGEVWVADSTDNIVEKEDYLMNKWGI